MAKIIRALLERLKPQPIKDPEKFGVMNEIQDALEAGNVSLVETLITEFPEAATGFQKAWLAERLAKK